MPNKLEAGHCLGRSDEVDTPAGSSCPLLVALQGAVRQRKAPRALPEALAEGQDWPG